MPFIPLPLLLLLLFWHRAAERTGLRIITKTMALLKLWSEQEQEREKGSNWCVPPWIC
jgi:hypothetical protein